jgi:hypothetical protein
MALRIRFQYPTGSTLGYSIERLSDGTFFDFSNATFTPSPSTLVAPLPEDTGGFTGRYKVTLSSTPAAQFTDGDYVVTVHNGAAANAVVGLLGVVMHSGDDATVFPGSGSTGTDPWATALPGSYPAGTAGAILGSNTLLLVSRLPGLPVADDTVGEPIRRAGHPHKRMPSPYLRLDSSCATGARRPRCEPHPCPVRCHRPDRVGAVDGWGGCVDFYGTDGEAASTFMAAMGGLPVPGLFIWRVACACKDLMIN